MKLQDIPTLHSPPAPWSEGEKIPWNDPAFSRRMLAEHLTQAHDLASRRFETIDRHVEWIHSLLPDRPSRVLDLGCGPGFYASRLARLGHEVHGIDFSPASIEYAVAEAERESLACTYRCEDLRQADFGRGLGLVMLVYGELNVFRPEETRAILTKARAALAPDGLLLLELHPFELAKSQGTAARTWYAQAAGLFSERPHLVLQEPFWDEERAVATTRWLVTDLETGEMDLHSQSMRAWTDRELEAMISACGYADVRTLPSLTGSEEAEEAGLVVWMAHNAMGA